MFNLSVTGGFRRGGSSTKVVVSRFDCCVLITMWNVDDLVWTQSLQQAHLDSAADLTLTVFVEWGGRSAEPGPRLGSVNCRSLFSFRAEFVRLMRLFSLWLVWPTLVCYCLYSLNEIQIHAQASSETIDWNWKKKALWFNFFQERIKSKWFKN